MLALLQPSQPTFPESQSRDTDGRTMPLRTAALLSAILLVWLPTALCHEDACLGEIRSGFERLQGQLTVFGDIRSGLERLHGQLTVFHNQLSVANQCPSGWSLHKNSCYLIPEVTATWLGANSICPSIDSRARLASVHLDNHQFLADMVAASDAEYVFVGGARLKLGATNFGWQDGTPFDYANWSPGQPDNKNGIEHCLCMQGPKSSTHSAQVGQMHDTVCIIDWAAFNFLCQISLTE